MTRCDIKQWQDAISSNDKMRYQAMTRCDIKQWQYAISSNDKMRYQALTYTMSSFGNIRYHSMVRYDEYNQMDIEGDYVTQFTIQRWTSSGSYKYIAFLSREFALASCLIVGSPSGQRSGCVAWRYINMVRTCCVNRATTHHFIVNQYHYVKSFSL